MKLSSQRSEAWKEGLRSLPPVIRVAVDARAAHPGLTGIGRYAANLVLSIERLAGAVSLHVITSRTGLGYLRSVGAGCESCLICAGDEGDELAIATAVKERRIDVYHSPLFLLPPLSGCATIVTLHDAIPLARPDLCPRAFMEFFGRHVPPTVARATRVVTVSEFSRSDIVKHLGLDPDRVVPIHEPVSPHFRTDTSLGDAALLSELGLDRGYVLFVGALDRRKNLGTLLDAYRILRQALPAAPPLAIVGAPSGDGYDVRVDVRRTGGERFVRLLGRVDDGALASLYRGAGCLVFPSLYEGFGLPVVEAMASGTPVVCSRASSLPEVAGDAALLFEPTRPAELAAALRRILVEPGLRSDLRERGLRRAAEFSLERHGARLEKLYRSLVERAA